MIYKRIISLFFVLICLTSVFVTGFYAEGEAEENEMTEETEAPTQKPTMAPTEPPKPSASKLGYAAYAKKLDETVYKDTDLGAVYSKDSTTFKVWSPAADDVKVCVYKTGSDSEEGFNTLVVKPMKYSKNVGTWYVTLDGDYKNMYYTYKVTVGGVTNEVVDPYAKAVGVNGNRGMIVDLKDTDPEGWSDDSFKRVSSSTDAVVWEVMVRDFSAADSSGVSEKNRGKFLAFTEDGTSVEGVEGGMSTCVAYLKELGVNYVQINPFYDFASMDESESLDEQYNWGYDPKNYNVPDGALSSDPYDGRVRIKECKQMIQALHKAGIGVIMDVVYNHTYESKDSFFNQLVPDYYYRIKEDGTWSNGSGCGNDVATERYMVSKFIRESVTYWAKEYHIDGFRFDLMGLMDVDTMNGIRSDLNKLPDGKNILMYGEAWNLSTAASSTVLLANQDNLYKLDMGIGAFNDNGRDAVKGSNFNAKEKGFVQDGSSKTGVRSSIDGDGSGWAKEPRQCVNYVSCHDNLTLYDKLTSSVYGDDKYTLRRDDLVQMNKLSAAIVLMSRGMPFMLAGEELGRTKLGDENSYISSVEINQIDWQTRFKYTSLTDYYKGLIKIRKAVPALRDATGEGSELTYIEDTDKNTIAYTVTAEDSPSVVVALNGSNEKYSKVDIPDGDWVIVADDQRAGLKAIGSAEGSVNLPPTSAMILIDAESFSEIEANEPESLLYIRYRDKSDSSIICEERLEGKLKEKYIAATPSEILFNYNIINKAELSGNFSEDFAVVDVECEAYEGDYSTVTVKYVDEKDNLISNTVVMTNRVGQRYYTPSVPGVDGYSLDLDQLPANGAGIYTDDPVEVTFRYKKNEKKDKDKKEDEFNCSANVIYMNEDGQVLDIKSYNGADGDTLEVDEMTFEGYKYYETTNGNAVFSPQELNVIMYYQKETDNTWIFILIGVGAVLLFIGLGVILSISKKRRINSISID